jgi:uncharacterized SAM-binding protein YcdF (DUF218 family)
VFFVVAKVLWFLLQPSSLMVGAVLGGAALSATRCCRLGRRLMWAGGLMLMACGLTPLGDLLILPLETRFPRAELDDRRASQPARPIAGIIVLGGGEDGHAALSPQLAPLNEAAERYTEAIALAQRLPHARVVFSGGSGALLRAVPPEAETAGRLFAAVGIAKDRIALEYQSRDTHENALFTARLLGSKPDERWLLVTSAWHMPRAMGCFRRAGLAVEPWPVDYRTSGGLALRFHSSIPEGLRRIDFIVREYIGLVVYYLAGRTDALLPGP